MKTYILNHNLALIDVAPPISGFEDFIGTYVLQGKKIALIDVGPAVSVDNLMSGLKELKINPADISFVFLSHIHLDHSGGIGKVINRLPMAKVIVHEKGAPHLIEPTNLWADSRRVMGELALQYEAVEPVPDKRIIIGRDGMLFDLGGIEIEILETPGHASHHLSFWDKRGSRLFSGEAASIYLKSVDLVRPSTPIPHNLEKAIDSLDRIMSLAPTRLYYAHFGGADNPTEKMRWAKEQLIIWGKVIADFLGKNTNNKDIYDEIVRNDTTMVQLNDLTNEKRERELYFINNSITGLVSYFQRYGTEFLQSIT